MPCRGFELSPCSVLALRSAFLTVSLAAGVAGCSGSSEGTRSASMPPFPAVTPAAGMTGPAAAGAAGAGSEMTGSLPLQPVSPALSRVLVFSRTLGFRHDSIGAGVTAIQKLGVENGFSVDPTEDPTRFNDATLADYDVVVFLSTTADVLDDTQQGAFQRYIQAGGG